MARQPVSTQVQGRNLAVTAAPVDTMVQPTAPTGGQILLQQLANIDSGIKGIIGGVQQLSQTRLNQEVFELEQNKRIEAEAARLKNAEAQAAKEAEAARKAMLKKSHEDELEIARQQLTLSVGSEDTSQVGSIISGLGSTGNNEGARDIATAAGKIIAAEVKAQINARTQGMSDTELRSFDVVGESKRLYNEIAKGYGLTQDSLKYIPATIVQDMMEIPASAQNDVLTLLAEGKNKNNTAAEKLNEAITVYEGAAKTLDNPKSIVGEFTANMAGATMDNNDTVAQAVHKSAFDTVVKSMDDLVAGVVGGSVSPEVAKAKLKEILEAANTEVPYRDGKNITIASFGNGKFSDAYKSAVTKVDSIKASQEAGASVDNLWINTLLKTSKDAASSGNKSRFDEIAQTVVGSDIYSKLTPAQKVIVDKQLKSQESTLYGNITTTNLDLRDAANALQAGDNEALEKQKPDSIKTAVTGGKPLVFNTPDFAQGVVNLQGNANGTLIGNEVAASVISDTFKTQPLKNPEEFKIFAQNLVVLHEVNPEYFKRVLQDVPQAKLVFTVSQAAGGLGTDPVKAFGIYGQLADSTRVGKTYSDSIDATTSSIFNSMKADDDFEYDVLDPNTRLIIHDSIRNNVMMGVPVDSIPETVKNQLRSIYTVANGGKLVKDHDGIFDEEDRKRFYDEQRQMTIVKDYVIAKTKSLIESKNNEFTAANEEFINDYFKGLGKYYGGFIAKPDSSGRTYIWGRVKDIGVFWDTLTDAVEPVVGPDGKQLYYDTKASGNIYLQSYQKSKKREADKARQVQLTMPMSPMQ